MLIWRHKQEHKYLTERLMDAFSRVENTSGYIPPCNLKEQLKRVPWINNPKGDKSTKNLVKFLRRKMKIPSDISAGQYVFRAGEKSDGMYFLKDGICICIQPTEGNSEEESEESHGGAKENLIYAGAFFGMFMWLTLPMLQSYSRGLTILTIFLSETGHKRCRPIGAIAGGPIYRTLRRRSGIVLEDIWRTAF